MFRLLWMCDTITDDNKEDVDNEEEKDTKNKNEDNEDDM